MTDLFWPGDERADDLFSEASFLEAMVAVESAWLGCLTGFSIAPPAAEDALGDLVSADDVRLLASAAEAGGNPVIPLVSMLRDRVEPRNPEAAHWLHRGLTSQDVVDTALMLCLARARALLSQQLLAQVRTLAGVVEDHRYTPMVARTLTQHAVPTTFGLKAAQWLTGVLDAWDEVSALELPVQVGGAAGTLAAVVELGAEQPDPVARALRMAAEAAGRLGLAPSTPWHTVRTAVTRAGDAAVRCTDAWGHIANDVLTLSRPEIGELSEGSGGGSSTMPHKSNPVLSTLVRRAALATPNLAATLHLASAESVDERADGGWHLEWATLRSLVRHAHVAGTHTTELLGGLRVHPERMGATLDAARHDVLAEQRSMADLRGGAAGDTYLGAASALVDAVLTRARTVVEETTR